VSALRWASREAGIRDAEVHAVHVREAPLRSPASYAVAALDEPRPADDSQMWQGVLPGLPQGAKVRTETAVGLVARVLLDRAEGADMLVLGASAEAPSGSTGPVIRACLSRAACPVVVITAAVDSEAVTAFAQIAVPVPAGA
jgi:nucleotide-binding universal stress UspA family protein